MLKLWLLAYCLGDTMNRLTSRVPNAHSGAPLTAEDIARSKDAPQFPDVTFEQMLADGRLADRIVRLNPVRYREIRADYNYRTGREARPAGFYDGQ